jgi:hypothetical protein
MLPVVSTSEALVLPPATGVRRVTRRIAREARGRRDGLRLRFQRPGSTGASTLVIGDSHAVLLFDATMPSPRVVRISASTSIVYLGPRLLHSFGRDGLPDWAFRTLRGRRRSVFAARDVAAVVALGEIDLRCHLAKPGRADPSALAELASATIERGRELLDLLGGDSRVVVLAPNPPSEFYESGEAGYPVVGGVVERVEILDRMVAALRCAIDEAPETRIELLDFRSDVADGNGQLRPDLTFDGCHLNAAGSAIVRRRLAELGVPTS